MPEHEQADVQPRYTNGELVSRKLKSYDFAARLDWIQSYPGVGFLPTGRGELNAAFRAVYYAALRRETAADGLERVRFRSMTRTSSTDALAAGNRSVKGAAGGQAAYANQARYDARRLWSAQLEATARADYPSAAAFFAGTPRYEGAGQLARYLDAQEAALYPKAPGSRAFRAQLVSVRGVSIVADPYTSRDPGMDMSRHITSTLSTVGMERLPALLGDAAANEDRRLAFWAGQLEAMLPDPAARGVAQAALRGVGY